MLGAILALVSAAFLGTNSVVVRRAVLTVSPNYMATLTVFCGPIFFFILALATGDLFKIPYFGWQAILFFALAGIIHFAMGRSFGYRAVEILGATRAGILTGLNIVWSIFLAVIILNETVTPLMWVGICFSLSGPTIIGLKEEKVTRSFQQRVGKQFKVVDRKTFFKGIFFGTCSAIFWGSSSIFIKLGLENGAAPLGGTFIAFSAAALVVSASLLNKKNRDEVLGSDWRKLRFAAMSGLTSSTGQMMRYLALNYGSVIVVGLVSRTMPIWTLTLSFIFNRKFESFSRWVLIGYGLLIIGTVLVLF
ncbi:MAG: DMT family transporter [Chloroflexi bacterium]|nr:DMT family transporter [Chloroflexota bacterium]